LKRPGPALHRTRRPHFFPQRHLETLNSLGAKARGEAVFCEGDVVRRILELDLRQENLVRWSPALAGV
jgi:hypothetical protein